MDGSDRRLELVRPGALHPQGPLDEPAALLDPVAIPARAVLVLEQDQVAGRRHARLAAGVLEEHQGEQPERLRLVGHQLGQDPGQADRLDRQLAADERLAGRGGVALVEDEVEDPQHGIEPLGQEVVGRDAIRDPRLADLALGPDEALGQGRLGDEEGAGDLGCREAAERPQRQRDLRVEGEGRDGST